jgi:hypothetical protein
MAVCGSFNLRGQLYCKAGSRGQSVQAGPCHKHQSAGALVSQGMAFAGPWPEEMVPEQKQRLRGCGLDSKPGMGVGRCWDFEAADKAEGAS